jgi:NTE family protein
MAADSRNGLSGRTKILVATSAGAFVAFLDVSIVNVAFPDIERSFDDVSGATLSWVLSAYNIAFAAFLLPAGRIAELVGRRRMYVGGLVAFTAASGLCAAAPSAETLVTARVLQAVAAAALIPASLASVLAAFPAERRASAAGMWGVAAALSGACGPSLGGVLIEAGGWRAVFLVNLPLGLAAAAYAARVLPEGRRPGRHQLPDALGIVLIAVAAASLALGIVQGNEWGWADRRIVGAFAAGALLIPVFLLRSRHHPAPVLHLSLFRYRSVSVANVGTFLFSAALFGMLLNNVLFLTSVWGYSLLSAGLALSPAPLVTALVAGPAGRVADRRGQSAVAAPGTVLFVLGNLWFITQVGTAPSFASEWLAGAIMTGAGVGLCYPALASAAIAALPAERFDVGSAVNAMFRQFGAALGVALVVAIVGTPAPGDAPAAFDGGWACAAVAALATFPLALALGRPGRHPDRRPDAFGILHQDASAEIQ